MVLFYLGHIKQKGPFKHVQNAQIQIILRMPQVSSGPLLSIHTFCSIQYDSVMSQWRPRTQGYKTFFMLTQLSMNVVLLINLKLLPIANSFWLKLAEHENFSANKYDKCQLLLSWVEHEKSFITSGPDQIVPTTYTWRHFFSWYGTFKRLSYKGKDKLSHMSRNKTDACLASFRHIDR